MLYIWHYFLVKNVFAVFSFILVVLHCYGMNYMWHMFSYWLSYCIFLLKPCFQWISGIWTHAPPHGSQRSYPPQCSQCTYVGNLITKFLAYFSRAQLRHNEQIEGAAVLCREDVSMSHKLSREIENEGEAGSMHIFLFGSSHQHTRLLYSEACLSHQHSRARSTIPLTQRPIDSFFILVSQPGSKFKESLIWTSHKCISLHK